MQLDSGQHVLELRDRAHDVRALGGMLFHDDKFFGRERPRLLEHAVVDADLAHVVEQGSDAQAIEVFGRKPQLLAQHHGVFGHAIGMAARVRVFFVDSGGEHANRAQEQVAIFLGGLL